MEKCLRRTDPGSNLSFPAGISYLKVFPAFDKLS